MTTLFTLAAHFNSAWATATELAPLLLVPALLWIVRTTIELLDRAARLVQLVHRAGHAVGTVWFNHGLPLLLAAADGTSWVNAQIDWAEVRSIVINGARTLLALAITAALHSHQSLIAVSAALGRRYSALLTTQPAPSAAAVPAPQGATTAALKQLVVQPVARPVVHPLAALATDLEQLSASQLRSVLGLKQRCSKRQLIGLALAC